MATHNEVGKTGEALAATWLIQQGFTVLHRNWRFARTEVDIIASKEDILHFIEVKTRTGNVFGHPEEQVDRRKMENIISAADEFQETYPTWKRIQFDILSINLQRRIEYFFIEDVFL